MSLNLPASVISTQDLKEIILETRKYSRWFAQSEVKLQRAGGNLPQQPVIAPATAELINGWAGERPLSQKSLGELIAALDNLDATMPRIIITLAAVAPTSLKHAIASWCRQNINRGMLVDFRFNSTLLGGMVVRYGSHVYDWSFRRQILAARGKFPEILRHV